MMNAFLLTLLLIQTGPPQPAGVVTGVVRGPDGKPAEGMRVFAIAVRDAAEAATGTTILEGQTETDAAGRYRLEVPPGRYLIGGGAVATPTYYPGTMEAAAARPVTVVSGVPSDNIDFSGLILPRLSNQTFIVRNLNFTPPSFATTISGTVRLQDGSPARGIEVVAVPVPRAPSAQLSPRSIPSTAVIRVRADDLGRFRLVNVPPGEFRLLSGTRDSPSLYPVPVTVTQPQAVENRDFTVSGVALGGRITVAGGSPGLGVRVRVHGSASQANTSDVAAFLSGTLTWETVVDGADGSYSVGGLPPGTYSIEASTMGAPSQVQRVTVGTQSVRDVDFSVPVALISGRIAMEDGSPLPNAALLGNVVLSTTGSPNLILSTIFRVSARGIFGSVLEPGDYRVEIPSSPHVVRSITAGGVDLMKQSLKVTGNDSVTIEILLGK